MVRLSLGLLGPMQVMLNGQPVTAFPYEKVRVLLAYLVIESDQRHHRDQLASMLWADQCEANARTNLRKALYTLRRLLGDSPEHVPLFFTTRNTIQFNSTGNHYTLDVATLLNLLNRPCQHYHEASQLHPEWVSNFEQAVALYRGPFLDQIQLPDCEAIETWIMLNRQRMHQLVVHACAQLISYYEHQHNYQKVKHYAQRQLQLEPWNEAAHRCLIQILAESGNRIAALQQYNRCRKVLERELAAEPEPATIALGEAIRLETFPDSTNASAIELEHNLV